MLASRDSPQGLAAMAGRRDDAISGYATAIATLRELGLEVDAALSILDTVRTLGAYRAGRGFRGPKRPRALRSSAPDAGDSNGLHPFRSQRVGAVQIGEGTISDGDWRGIEGSARSVLPRPPGESRLGATWEGDPG